MDTAPTEYLTPSEAADLVRVSLRQIRRWRACGLLPAHVSPWRPRYRREEVEAVAEHLGAVSLPR